MNQIMWTKKKKKKLDIVLTAAGHKYVLTSNYPSVPDANASKEYRASMTSDKRMVKWPDAIS